MEFVILGPTALQVAGRSVPLGAAKQRGMLAVLLYHAGSPVKVETIVDHLWSGRSPVDRRANLYALASRTRAVLSAVGLGDALVRISGIGAYRLDIDPKMVDYHHFRLLLAEGRQAAGSQRFDLSADLLSRAVDMWRHEPLADLRGAQSEHLRQYVKSLLLDAQKLLVDCQLRIGQHHSALVRLESLVQDHDTDEVIARHWMAALSAAGRDDEARTYFATFRRRFRREMHAEPAVERPSVRIGAPARPTGGSSATAPTAVPHQLPKDITDFAGHGDLLASLDALTAPGGAGASVVTINGMPGAGKTTFVVHWAHRHIDRFPDGQLYINTNGYGPPPVEPDQALGRFLHALNVQPERMPSAVEQRRELFNQLIAGRQMLIVLDNVYDCAQVRPLIPTSDGCVTLITSRNRLRGLTIREGVPTLTVPPLLQNECLRMLRGVIGVERAAAEPDAVRALARLSDGLPLAVRVIGEHVAARPRALIAELVDELTAHLLDSDEEDDTDSDLRSVFAWSYNALTPDAARLFRLLGLHPGPGISPDAAAALLGVDTHCAERLLNILAKAHLIDHDVARRYRFHDLLRRYAEDKANTDEPDQLRADAIRRLLDWFVLSCANAATVMAPDRLDVPDLPVPVDVEPLTFANGDEAMKWCDAERGNVTGLTRMAITHAHYRHAWQIPDVLHDVIDRHGRLDHVLELLELALVAANRDGHRKAQIGTLSNIGSAYFLLRDYERAGANFARSLELAKEIQFTEAETACTHNLASVHLKMGDPVTAIDLYQRLLSTCSGTGNPTGEAATMHRLGDAFRLTGRLDEAATHYLGALTIRERIGSLRGQGATHGELAALYLQIGNRDAALEHCCRALDIHAHTKDEAARCDALIAMADIKRELQLYEESARAGSLAVDLAEEIDDPQRQCQALTVLADAQVAAGDSAAAAETCARAVGLVDQLVDPGTGAVRQRLMAVRDLMSSRTGPPPGGA